MAMLIGLMICTLTQVSINDLTLESACTPIGGLLLGSQV